MSSNVYYCLIKSISELIGEEGVWRVPSYILEEFVMDEARKDALDRCLKAIASGRSILITGPPGAGKTAFMVFLMDKIIRMGLRAAILLDNALWVSNEHVDRGIIIFCDDLNLLDRRVVRMIFRQRMRGLVATIRRQEIETVRKITHQAIERIFEIVDIGAMKQDYLKDMIMRYAFREGIEIIDAGAIDIICRKSGGLPVYIWQVIRELKIKGGRLDVEFAKRVPQGMLNYVDSILWSILDEHPERYEILLLLRILSDLPKYRVHQDLYNAIYITAKEAREGRRLDIKDALFSDLLDKVTRYLAIFKDKYQFGLPHESWADVLRGKSSGPLGGEISKINIVYPYHERRRILEKAIGRVFSEIIPNITDQKRKNFLIEYIKTVKTFKKTKPYVSRRPKLGYIEKTAKLLMQSIEDKITPEICEKAVSLLYATDRFRYVNIASAIIVRYTIETGDTYYFTGTLRKLARLKSPIVASNIAVYYYYKGHYKTAYKYFQRAIENGDMHSHLAMALLNLMEGCPYMAIRHLRKYLSHRRDQKIQKLLDKIANYLG